MVVVEPKRMGSAAKIRSASSARRHQQGGSRGHSLFDDVTVHRGILSDLRDQGRAHTGGKRMVGDDVPSLFPELTTCSVSLVWAGAL
jgi:hypothetical protein